MARSLGIWALLLSLFLGAYLFIEFYLGIPLNRVLSYLIILMPIWLPVASFFLFFDKWIGFVQYQFALKNGRTTIEIFLPQEVYKSPVAMELVLNSMFQTAGIDNHVQSFWDGKHPPVFSLELVSTHGQVRFLINLQPRYKNLIESQLYSQYPGIEIRELEHDYTAEIPEKGEGYGSFAFHYKLKKADAYPIRTYFDYGLQANPKEEEKIDPLSITLETLGSLGRGEHMWLQFLIKANKGYSFKEGSLTKSDDWKGGVQKEIEAIIANAKKRGASEDENGSSSVQLTEAEKDNIKALERSVSKYAFDTYVRSIYIAEEDVFNGGNIAAMAIILRPFDDVVRNSIGVNWRTEVNWPWWQDRGGRNSNRWKAEEIEDYKRRSYTERHKKDNGMVLTTEELATLFHIPGSVVLSPRVQRIGSTRGEAPGNLPI